MRAKLVLLSVLAAAAFPPAAHAYLDPGTGSVMVQLTIGAVLACAMTFKLWRRRLAGFFGRLLHKNNKTDSNAR